MQESENAQRWHLPTEQVAKVIINLYKNEKIKFKTDEFKGF